jgi:hypothetical protein
MNKFLLIPLCSLVSACAAYKVVPEGSVLRASSDSDSISVKKLNKWPEGGHCFEPMLFVLTLGVIPTHCVDTYSAETDSHQLAKIKVTSMQGWIPLLLAPFSPWKYGYALNVESEIYELVKAEE